MTKTTTYIFKDYNGEVIAEFSSLDEAATTLGVTRQTICNLVSGKVKRSVKVRGTITKVVETISPAEEEIINFEGEEWRTINGYEQYEVSNYGRIRRGNKLKHMSPSRDGYIHTCLRKDGEQHSYYVHRIVAAHFLPDWDPSLVVNHKDENKANNHISNLEQMTQAENVRYSYELHKDTWGRPKKTAAAA